MKSMNLCNEIMIETINWLTAAIKKDVPPTVGTSCWCITDQTGREMILSDRDGI